MLPLPTYDLSDLNRVSVTIYGKVLNEAYTQLLAAEPNMDLGTVFLLGLVQKGKPIGRDQAKKAPGEAPFGPSPDRLDRLIV